MICKFTSTINDVAKGSIIYEMHDLDEKSYLIKWKINESDNYMHSDKIRKTIADKMFRDGRFITV